MKLMSVTSGHSSLAGARISRVEWAIVVALFLVGAVLRCAFPSRMAVEHFDEGVYASNIFFDADYGYRYPAQHLFAPPLLPTLIEWVFILFGPSNFGAMVPSLVAGCLTVPLVWWVGRSWFGPSAGLAGAALCALSDPHITFSRTALTDVLLCFWLLLAVYFVWLALTTRGLWPTIAAGVFTGLAWWTKYNGWLPLAIGGAAAVPWWVLCNRAVRSQRFPDSPPRAGGFTPPVRQPPRNIPPASDGVHPRRVTANVAGSAHTAGANPAARLPQLLAGWVAIAAIAFAVWSPWLWSLQSEGGYAAVAANHRGYLVGLPGWWDALRLQCDNLTRLEGIPGQHGPMAGFIAAAAGIACCSRRFTWNRLTGTFGTWLAVAVVLTLPAVVGGWVVTTLFAAGGLVVATCIPDRIGGDETLHGISARDLATWMLTAWFVGLTLTTPLYTPYPRLTLPWLMAGWIAGGLGFERLSSVLGRLAERKNATATGTLRRWIISRTSQIPRGVLVFGSIAGCVVSVWMLEVLRYRDFESSFLTPRNGVRDAAAAIATAAMKNADLDQDHEQDQLVIYTFAEPALLFQLRLAGITHVYPVASLGFAHRGAAKPSVPTFVAFGRQARKTPGFESELSKSKDRLERVTELFDRKHFNQKGPHVPSITERFMFRDDLLGKHGFFPSDLVLLDNQEAPERPLGQVNRYELELFRVR